MQQCKPTTITPQADKGGYLFESGLFGVNAEITRKGMFGGLCAQMLNNRTDAYSFENNDFTVCKTTDAALHGHSVLFIKAVPCGQQ